MKDDLTGYLFTQIDCLVEENTELKKELDVYRAKIDRLNREIFEQKRELGRLRYWNHNLNLT